MTDIANLVIKADTSQVKTATNDLNKLSQAGGKAESASNGLASSFASFRGVLGALGLGVTISQLVTLGDTYTTLKSKLGLVTDSLEQLTDVQSKLLDIANNQRKPLAEVTELYVKSANAASELGASQEDLLKFTEGVSAALTVNGTTTAAAAGALLQLGQAIGGNIIQAQEYNSLIDGARPLLQAVADNMDKAGGSVNRLTMLVRDGKVTSKEFFDAAVKGSSDLITKSGEMEITVGQALTVMGNTMLTYVGRLDDATEATNTLAQAILNAAKSDTLRITFETLAVLGVNVAYVFRQVGNEIGGMAAQLAALGKLDFKGFKYIREQMLADAKAARIEVDRLTESILNPKASTDSTGKPKPNPRPTSFLGGGGGSSSKMLKENAAAMELATTYASLFESINQLNNVDKSQTDLLRDKLNAITNVDKATKDYINTQLNQIDADEQRRASIAENVQKQIEFNKSIEDIKDAIDPTREYTREVEKLKEMYKLNRITAEEYAAAVGQAKERMTSFSKSTKDEFEELKDAINGFSKDATNALVNFAFGASSSFEQMANDFAKAIARMIIQKQLMDPLFNAISSGMSSGSFSGMLGSVFGGLFGGSADIAPSASPTGIIGASYANGSEYIPRDMYAKLHAGERVLTKDENREFSKGREKPAPRLGNVVMNFMVSGTADMRSQQQIAAAAFGGINRAYRRNA